MGMGTATCVTCSSLESCEKALSQLRDTTQDAGKIVPCADRFVRMCCLGALQFMGSGRQQDAFHWLCKAEEITRPATSPLATNEELRLRMRAVTLNNMGIFYFKVGRLQAAERYFAEAIVHERTTSNPENPAATLINYAQTLAKLGKLDRALETLTEATAMLHHSIDCAAVVTQVREHEGLLAQALAHTAYVFEAQREWAKAVSAFEAAVSITRKVKGPADPSVYTLDQKRLRCSAKLAEGGGVSARCIPKSHKSVPQVVTSVTSALRPSTAGSARRGVRHATKLLRHKNC